MYWRTSEGLSTDGIERRPVLWDEKTLAVDTASMAERRDRMHRLRRERVNDLFCAVLADEVAFTQCMYSPTATGSVPWRPGKAHWRLYPAQIGFYTDRMVVGYCGRDIGKTTSMRHQIPQEMVWYDHSNAIFTSFDQDHVNPRMTEVFQALDEHPLLRIFVHTGDGSRKRSHPQSQRMLNGFVLYGISGGQTEQSASKVESPHVNSLYGDEFQKYTRWAWNRIQNSINDQRTNLQHGACIKLYGVNSEGRQDIVFHELGHKLMPFREHLYRVASWDTPRYTLDQHTRYLDALGHSVDASEFKQQIRGLTGERAFGVFNEEAYAQANELWNRIDKGAAQYRFLRINRKIWESHSRNMAEILSNWAPEPKGALQCLFSADYGRSAPSELGIWYEIDHPTRVGTVWTLMARVEIIGLEGNEQAEIFDYLMQDLGPTRFSIDSTGATNTVYTILTDENDVRYNNKGYRQRLFPARMNGDVVIAYEREKPPDGVKCRKEVVNGEVVWGILQPSNVFATDAIREMLSKGTIAIPEDEHMRREFNTLIEKHAANGAISYAGNQQHVISMFRCLTLLLHEDVTLEARRKDLADAYTATAPVGQYFQVGLSPTGEYSRISDPGGRPWEDW